MPKESKKKSDFAMPGESLFSSNYLLLKETNKTTD